MEHLQHFGLSDDPFRNEPCAGDYFDSPASRDALARLDRGLRQSKGLLVLTGDVGCGKTMVVRRLLDNLEEAVFDASMLVMLSGAADSSWLLASFARQLGVEEPADGREDVLGQVYEQLALIREAGRHAVLIIDDAHALASRGALADVCGLLKLEYEERRLFSMVLAGGPELEQAIAADPTLSRRVEIKVRMPALDASAAAEYLGKRLDAAGGDVSILENEAVEALYGLSEGLPGLMNTLADNALFGAFRCGHSRVSAADVARAHAELGWSHASVPKSVESILLLTDPQDTASGTTSNLDSQLDATFPANGSMGLPTDGPPKDDDEEEDLVATLLED